MTLEQAVNYIQSVRWQEAKTYRKTAPHEYTIRQWEPQRQDEFEAFAKFIRAEGVQENYYHRIHTYWYHGEHKYWTMGEPIHETVVINRCLISDYYPNTNIYVGRGKLNGQT